MNVEFSGEVWFWRGPAPHHFVTVPSEHVPELAETAASVSYGWGCVPATVRLGGSTFTTALFPKNGGYIVPLKAAVRRTERVELGDTVTISLTI